MNNITTLGLAVLALTAATQRLAGAELLDPSFQPVVGIDSGAIQAMCLTDDGRIYIGGSFYQYDWQSRNYIARLKSDGTLDNTFNPGQGPNFEVLAMIALPDGKVVIGGAFWQVSSFNCPRVARLRVDGSLDVGFSPDFAANGTVTAMARQPDGKILVAGTQFELGNANTGLYRQTVARLNEDGTADLTFSSGTIWGDWYKGDVYAMALQPDGKILIAGAFKSINGQAVFGLARLHTTGALDPTFSPPPFDPNTTHFTHLALQPDGKVLIAGDFSSIDGYARVGLARLNSNGSLDIGNDPGPSTEPIIRALALQKDGKILDSQNRSSVGYDSGFLVRRNPDGKGDVYLGPAYPTKGVASSIVVQPDGRILVAGNLIFLRGDMTYLVGIARITPLYLLPSQALQDGSVQVRLVGERDRHYVVQGSTDLKQWETLFNGVSNSDVTYVTDRPTPTQQHRFYRASQQKP